jgi:hypothetical protein
MGNMDLTARLLADNAQFDAAMAKSAKEATATGAATEKAAKRGADAQKFASQFIGDAVTKQSVALVNALKKQREAYADFARAQKIAASGYVSEGQGIQAMAAAHQRLQTQLRATAEAQKAVNGGNKNGGGMNMSSMLKGLASVAAIGELISKMKEAVTESLDFGEAIQRASEKTGLSVGTLSTLHYAAGITGGDFDKMSSAVAKMDKTIAAATEGDKKAESFMRSLGLNASELAGRSDGAEIAFKKFASTMADTENPIRRVELATGLLGKAGAEQIPTILQLGNNWDAFRAKAAAAGVQLDGKTAESLAATNQRLKDMQQKVLGAQLAFTDGLTPGLNQFMSALSNGAGPMSVFTSLGERLAAVMNLAAAAAYGLASGTVELAALGDGGRLTSSGREMLDLAASLDAKAQEFREAMVEGNKSGSSPIIPAVVSGGGTGGDGGFGGTGGDPGSAAKAEAAANKAREQRLKGYTADLDQMKQQTNVSVKVEYDFWSQRIDAFKQGSEQYDAIVAKQASLAVEGAKAAHEAILKFQKESNETANLDPKEANEAMAAFNARLREQAEDVSRTGERWKVYNAEIAKNNDLMVKSQEAIKALQAEHGVKTGAMSKGDAAQVMTGVHATDSAAKIAQLQQDLADLKADAKNFDPNGKDYERQKPENEAQQKAVQGAIATATSQAQLQAMQDKWEEFSNTAVGGAVAALQELTAAAMDNAALMKHLVDSALSSVNNAILNPGQPGSHRFKAMGLAMGKDAEGEGLKYGEGTTLKMLGKLGVPGLGGKRDGSSATAALYVHEVGAAALGKSPFGAKGPSTPNVSAMPNGLAGLLSPRTPGADFAPLLSSTVMPGADTGSAALGQSLFGANSPAMPDVSLAGGASPPSMLKTLMSYAKLAIPFLDVGTDYVPHDMLAMVHQGEAVVPKKYNQPGGMGGGDTHYHYNVDARQSNNPAQTAAYVQAAIEHSRKQAVRQAIAATQDIAKRKP